MFNNRGKKLVVAITLVVASMGISAVEPDNILIDRAKAAAPAGISTNATIMINGKTVVKGTNAWVCMPDTMPGDKSPMCNDAMWMKMMAAVASKQPFTADGIGISYMLKGDVGSGVSNSDPYHPDAKNAADYVETGPHLMIIVPKELLKGMSDDPSTGEPYVMWKNTPYAHIMVPIADKEK